MSLYGLPDPKKWPLWAKLAPLFLVMFIADLFKASAPYDVNLNRRIVTSARYAPPPGCQITKALQFSHIPKACVTDITRISDVEELGFRPHHSNDNWIRIGSDAVDAQCTFGDCFVIYVGENKFEQGPDSTHGGGLEIAIQHPQPPTANTPAARRPTP